MTTQEKTERRGRPAGTGKKVLLRMQAVIDYVRAYHKTNGYAPTLSEIAEGVTGNPANFGHIQAIVQALIQQGFLVNAGKNKGRTLNVAKKPPRKFYYKP